MYEGHGIQQMDISGFQTQSWNKTFSSWHGCWAKYLLYVVNSIRTQSCVLFTRHKDTAQGCRKPLHCSPLYQTYALAEFKVWWRQSDLQTVACQTMTRLDSCLTCMNMSSLLTMAYLWGRLENDMTKIINDRIRTRIAKHYSIYKFCNL